MEVPNQVWQPLPTFNDDEDEIVRKIIPQTTTKLALMHQFFESLSSLKNTLVFSLIAEDNTISFELSYAEEDSVLIEQQLAVHFPDCSVINPEDQEDYGNREFYPETFFIPLNVYGFLKTMSEFHLDPYRHICEVLTAILDRSQTARFEIMCKPFSTAAINSMVSYFQGDYFPRGVCSILYPNYDWSDQMVKAFQKKLPVWGVTVRWTYFGEDDYEIVTKNLKGALQQYENIEQQWYQTLHEDWNLISVDELVSLAHFPTEDLNCDRLELTSMKAKLPPPLYTTGETRIGVSEARGQQQTVYLPEEVRDRHVYLVGKSGTGKSTLMETIIQRDIEAGRGLAVIDPTAI
jgi:hypothetical protein